MVPRLVQVVLLAVLAVGCATRAPDFAPPLSVPVADPLLASAAAESLWRAATEARTRGDLPAAARYLERASGVAPDSSWLYREMAELRLYQDDPVTAEGLARRALRLAPDDPGYRSALWELIATARARRGDEAGADAAREASERLRRATRP